MLWIHASSGHCVYHISFYKTVSHNFQFPFSFQHISFLFDEIYE